MSRAPGYSKEEKWCNGTIEYTRRSTKEFRIAFDEVGHSRARLQACVQIDE
jgi:hypothetical protein